MKTLRGKLQLLRSKWRGGKEGHLHEDGRMVIYASTDAFRGNGARTLIIECVIEVCQPLFQTML